MGAPELDKHFWCKSDQNCGIVSVMKLTPLDQKQLNDLITKHSPELMKDGPHKHPYQIGDLKTPTGSKVEAFLRSDGQVVIHVVWSNGSGPLARHSWFTFDMKKHAFYQARDVRNGSTYEDK